MEESKLSNISIEVTLAKKNAFYSNSIYYIKYILEKSFFYERLSKIFSIDIRIHLHLKDRNQEKSISNYGIEAGSIRSK